MAKSIVRLFVLTPFLFIFLGANNDIKKIDIVAASVRAKGFTCDQPDKMQQDKTKSGADRPVWVIWCDKGKKVYSVTYFGDDRTIVEPIRR